MPIETISHMRMKDVARKDEEVACEEEEEEEKEEEDVIIRALW